MRKWLRYGLALAVTLVALVAVGRSPRERADEPRVRELDADAVRQATQVRIQEARLTSLWTEGRLVECLAPALYPDQAEGARLSGALRVVHADAKRHEVAVIPSTPVYVSVRRGANSPGLQLVQLLAV